MTFQFFYSKIFITICILSIIYTSGYALSTVYDIRIYIEFIFAYIFLVPILSMFRRKQYPFLKVSLILLLVMIILTFVATGFDAPLSYLSYILPIIFALGVVLIYRFSDFMHVFSLLMVSISCISLIGYIAVNVLNFELPLLLNKNFVPYGIGYLFFYIPLTPERNMGIFWEPGLFATFLCIALVFEIVYKQKKANWFKIFLFIFTILTTQSSAGYGLLFFILVLVILKKTSKFIRYIYLQKVITFCVFALCVLFLFNYTFVFEVLGLTDNEVVKKLMGDELSEQSRLLAINHNLGLFLTSPIFGVGITEAAKNIKYVADTSTSSYLMSIFGILGFQYTFYWIYGIILFKRRDIFVNIMVATIFLFIINKEPHFSNVFSWCILFYFLKRERVNDPKPT